MSHFDFITYCNEDTIKNILPQNRSSERKLSIREFNDVIILPSESSFGEYQGEICDYRGNLISDINSNVNYRDITTKIDISTLNIGECEEELCIYLGSIPNCWGHFITDGLSKLWWIKNNITSEILKQILVVIPYNTKVPKSYILLLTYILGVELNIKIVDRIKRYNKVLIPDNAIFIGEDGRTYTTEYKALIENICSNVTIPSKLKYDNIYLSRSNWIHVNPEFGESAIEKAFNKVGYKSISPEKYTFEEQLAMFMNAKSIVSTSGSLAHNSLFCKEGTEIIILRKSSSDCLDYQQMIDQMKNHKVTYIDCNLSVFLTEHVGLGPFFLYINDKLSKFFKDRFSININENFSSKQFLEYSLLCMKRNDFFYRNPSHNELGEYLYKKMSEELRNEKNIYKRIYNIIDVLGLNSIKSTFKKIYYKIKRA